MSWLLDQFLGRKLAAATDRYVRGLAQEPALASRRNTAELIQCLNANAGPKVLLGETSWGEPVNVPLAELVQSHGLITGSSGSGKTMVALLIVSRLLETAQEYPAGFAVVDGAKCDLFLGTLYLIQRRLEELAKCEPTAASRLRRRVRIIDFAAPEAITPFNILARWPGVEAEAFASHQVDLLLDVVPDGDALKLAAAPLKSLVQILSEPEIGMSVIDLIRAVDDELFLIDILARCRDRALVGTLRRQLATVSKSTRSALRRRLEALVSSKSVARMLAGRTAPDFCRLQDDGCYVVVNCAGPNISGRLTRFLNTLVVSNFCRSIFARRRPEMPFLLIADEAQDLLGSSVMREHLGDAGRLARGYGTHLCLITQNLSASVPDARLLSLLHTNARWTWSGRGDPADCAFLKPVLPATGRRPRPKLNPFEETRFYSVSEENGILLEEVANLPNRTGYFWLKGRSSETIQIRTQDLDIPQGRELELATLAIRRDPTIGMRVSRKEYERQVAEQDRKRTAQGEDGHLERVLEETYRLGRQGA